jgi:hypothetical protein
MATPGRSRGLARRGGVGGFLLRCAAQKAAHTPEDKKAGILIVVKGEN